MTSSYTYKRAELLTKSWLMGVRRGWLSLLKPSIRDWDDVIKAFDRLLSFVGNLKDQIYLVRRSPYTLKGMPEGEKLEKAFKGLEKAIRSQKDSALHWKSIAEDPDVYGRGTFRKDDSAKMFDLYQNKFGDILEVHIKTRATPEHPYRSTRPANVTELLDSVLVLLRAGAKRLEDATKTEEELLGTSPTREEWGEPAFKEFSFGHMKVVVTDPKARGGLIKSYVKELDKAYQLTAHKGFKKLWYGVLFIESESYKNLNPQEIEAYKAYGYHNLRSRAGVYKSGEDVVALTRPPQGLATTLVHEVGHRYWFKFMQPSQRAKFESLVKVNVIPKGKAPESIDTHLLEGLEKDIHNGFLSVSRELGKFEKATLVPPTIDKARKIFEDAQRTLSDQIGFFKRLVLKVAEKLDPYLYPNEDPTTLAQWRHVLKALSSCEDWALELEELGLRVLEQKALSGEDLRRAFDKERDVWVEELRGHLMGVEGHAYQFIIDMNETQGRKVKEALPHIDPNDPRPVLPVSEYGKSNAAEAFAEAFAHYVMGEDMTRDQIESFRSVLATTQPPVTHLLKIQRVVQRFLHACN